MALTTALTNTNFSQLSEAMKLAAPAAKFAGFSLSETASAMGVLANAGIKGSLAGTALKNALAKLAKPSKEALELFGGRQGMDKALFRIVDGQKKLKPLEVIMANITKSIQGSKDPLEATRKAFEILGLRGAVSFSAFSSAIGKETKVTAKNLESLRKGIEISGEGIRVDIGDTLPSLVALRLQIAGAEGTAKKMAAIRLDNLKGQFTLFRSALEGLSIEIGSLVTGPLKGMVKVATDVLSVLTIGFQVATSGGKATAAQLDALNGNQFKDMLDFAVSFAQGFIEGFNELKATAKEVFASISSFLRPIIGDSGLTAKEIGKIVAKIIVIGAIAAPILGAIAIGFFVLGPIITGIIGLVGAIASVFTFVFGVVQVVVGVIGIIVGALSLPVLLVIAAVAAAIAIFLLWGDEIKAFGINAFNSVVGFLGALQAPFIAFGAFLLNVLLAPIKAFTILLGSVVQGMASLLGDKLLSKFGLSTAKIGAFVSGTQSALTFGEDTPETNIAQRTTSISEESNKLAKAATTNTVLIQPPSAGQIAASQAQQGGAVGPQQAGPAPAPQKVEVVVTGKLRGRDIHLAGTRESLSQSDRNGLQLNPETKRRMNQNGAMATGV